MKRSFVALIFAFVLSSTPAYADAQTPSAVVKSFYAKLVSAMKQGPQLGYDGRYKVLSPAVQEAYDMAYMTKVAVGPSWTSASPEQQQKLIKAFSSFSAATYASRFSSFDGEKFEVVGEKPATGGSTMVETNLVLKSGDTIKLNYLVRNDDGGKPRVVDVLLDASISELATRRSEFTSIVKRDGFPALIATLEEKTKKMETL
jgi:phospholipid transport system substrate-binding protein